MWGSRGDHLAGLSRDQGHAVGVDRVASGLLSLPDLAEEQVALLMGASDGE